MLKISPDIGLAFLNSKSKNTISAEMPELIGTLLGIFLAKPYEFIIKNTSKALVYEPNRIRIAYIILYASHTSTHFIMFIIC